MNDHLWKFARHIIFIGISCLPALVQAAGLGSLSVYSYLGQNLNGEIKLLASPDEIANLTAKIAAPDAFERAGIPFSPALTSIRAALDKRGDGTVVVKLTSAAPINDPYVELLVELTWPQGQIVRQFTFLLDPPGQTKGAAAEEVTVPDTEYPPIVPAEKTDTKLASAADATVEDTEEGAIPDSEEDKPTAGTKSATEPVAPSSKTQKAAGGSKKATGENNEIVVRRGDNLYGIAQSLSVPADVTLEQVMIALYRANKRQFINNNINLIRAGRTLVVPGDEDYYAVSSKEARRIVQSQTADFHEYQANVAGAPMPVLPKAVTSTASGTVRGTVNDRGAVVPSGGDKLQVAQSSPSAQSLNNLREELASKNRALQEAQSKINELEKIIQESNKLLKLQGGAPATSPPAPVTKPAAPTTPTPAPVLPPPTVSTAPASPPVVPATADTTTQAVAASTSSAATAPVPQPKPKPRPAPPPPPKGFFSSLFDDSSSLVYAGLALLLGLLGFFGFRYFRNRSAQSAGYLDEDEDIDERPMKSRSKKKLINSENQESVAEKPTVDEEFMDPLAEADSYLAFGREEQAIQVLQEALDKEPNQVDYQLKLLEIFSSTNDTSRFNSLAMDIFASTGGKGQVWNSVLPMGRKLDPGNTLYQEKISAPAARLSEPPKPTAAPVSSIIATIASDVAPPRPVVEAKPTSTLQSPGDLSRMAQMATAAPLTPVDTLVGAKLKVPDKLQEPVSAPETQEQPADVLDLDFEQMSQPTGGFDLNFQGTPQAAAEDDSIDLDLTTQAQEVGSGVALETASQPAAIDMDLDFESMSKPLMDEPADVDFDISSVQDLQLGALPSQPPIAQAVEKPVDQKVEKSTLDLEASAGLLLPDISLELPPGQSPKTPPANQPKPTFDTENTMLTLDLPHPSPISAAATPAPIVTAKEDKIEPLSISVDSIKSPETHDGSAINIKLELVKAYEAMGNKEGAKELLEEVLKEGTSEQQKLARSLLTKLS